MNAPRTQIGDASIGVTLIADNIAAARGGRLVFDGVSLTLAPGKAIVLRGANGAGKTTLLRVLAGVARPENGRVVLVRPGEDGEPPALADACVFVGHQEAAKAALSVARNMAFWAAIYDRPAAPLDAIRAQLKLADLADRPAGTLSAGQRRRLGVARALVSGRPIWLLDEPTASLDAASSERIAQAIGAHCAGGGAAIVATHEPIDLPEARALRMTAIQ